MRAARREQVERTPVWFMRQAGRSLPEYRAIREQHAFFEIANTPELCAEVTLQPVRRHDVDAAVMFADIITPVLGMGIDIRLVDGVGPVIDEPIRTLRDVEKLRQPGPRDVVRPCARGGADRASRLRPDQAVVGFCGGPFTVAGYLIEGKPSREFAITKQLMLSEPAVWHALLERLADVFAGYVAAKARAGADVIQLFDSWVGALSPGHYREYVAPYSARVLAAVDVPTIHFGTGTATLLEEMAAAGGDVIGLDWRIPLDVGWEKVPDRAVQGNLDPAVLLAPWERVESEALEVLARAARPARPHLQPRPRRPARGAGGHADEARRARTRARARDRRRRARDPGEEPVTPGAIVANDVSRRFHVHARETRTLKELLVNRGRRGGEDVWALRGVSLEIEPGQAVGLVGRNGSGKSTLLRVLAGIIRPTSGTVSVEGRIGSLLELGAGFHPDFTGRENVFLNGSIQGLRRAEIRERFDEIVGFAELEHAIDRPVRTYSSGMAMRLGFAIAAFLEADVLLLDEVFAVGDENFQRKCFGVIAAFKNRGGTILFVSHDAHAVERLCERAVLLSHGEKAFEGPTHEAISRYRRLLADEIDPAERGAGLARVGRRRRGDRVRQAARAGRLRA